MSSYQYQLALTNRLKIIKMKKRQLAFEIMDAKRVLNERIIAKKNVDYEARWDAQEAFAKDYPAIVEIDFEVRKQARKARHEAKAAKKEKEKEAFKVNAAKDAVKTASKKQ